MARSIADVRRDLAEAIDSAVTDGTARSTTATADIARRAARRRTGSAAARTALGACAALAIAAAGPALVSAVSPHPLPTDTGPFLTLPFAAGPAPVPADLADLAACGAAAPAARASADGFALSISTDGSMVLDPPETPAGHLPWSVGYEGEPVAAAFGPLGIVLARDGEVVAWTLPGVAPDAVTERWFGPGEASHGDGVVRAPGVVCADGVAVAGAQLPPGDYQVYAVLRVDASSTVAASIFLRSAGYLVPTSGGAVTSDSCARGEDAFGHRSLACEPDAIPGVALDDASGVVRVPSAASGVSATIGVTLVAEPLTLTWAP